MYKTCIKCKTGLSSDEIALTRKLIHRNCTEYMCLECMAKHFNVSKEGLKEKIEYFKKTGCILFSK